MDHLLLLTHDELCILGIALGKYAEMLADSHAEDRDARLRLNASLASKAKALLLQHDGPTPEEGAAHA